MKTGTIIFYLIAGIFIVMGIGIRYFKWNFLISGYNFASRSQRERVDIAGLSRFLGMCTLLMGLDFAIMGVFLQWDKPVIIVPGVAVFIGLVIYTLIQSNLRYTKDFGTQDKAQLIVATVILGLVFVIVGGMLWYGARDPQITISQDNIVISGMYGRTIPLREAEVLLVESLPDLKSKTNGLDIGDIRKGSYQETDGDMIYLNVLSSSGPYLLIHTDEGDYYLNRKSENETRALYQQLGGS